MPGAPEPSGRQLNPTRRTTSCLEDQDKKMPKENSPAEWMPKVHFQTGGIRPISDRHPQACYLRVSTEGQKLTNQSTGDRVPSDSIAQTIVCAMNSIVRNKAGLRVA